MIPYPNIDPVLISIGPLQIRWYGLMYIMGFLFSYLLVRFQLNRQKEPLLSKDQVLDLYFYLILGLIIGARLGYVVFYNLKAYLNNPLELLAVWHGGMSFHGGFIGVLLAVWWFCRKNSISLLALGDLIIVTAPIGLGLGRLANFINGELYGRITTVSWGMVFPQAGPLPRHPSQLYEAFLEGLVLFVILWITRNAKSFPGALVARFLILYGLFRTLVEFFREPDAQLGYFFGFLTMGQLLSLFMILMGGVLIFGGRRNSEKVRSS
jgi:phosphatidylglycerol---prolipoprotein diacylglyceryl transferase